LSKTTGGASMLLLYFDSHGDPITSEFESLALKSKALVIELAIADATETREEMLNDVLHGNLEAEDFAKITKTTEYDDLMSLYKLIHRHPSLQHIYFENSTYTEVSDPWSKLSNEGINPNSPMKSQLQQLHKILAAQAALHKSRDDRLAQQLAGLVRQDPMSNILVKRGRAHQLALPKACETLGLEYEAHVTEPTGAVLLQEELLTRMAAGEEPTEDELKIALRERTQLGSVS